jgi:hypothetical protein
MPELRTFEVATAATVYETYTVQATSEEEAEVIWHNRTLVELEASASGDNADESVIAITVAP